MRLSVYGYYSDFLVYPLCIGGLAILGLHRAQGFQFAGWLGIVFASVLAWTLIEYGLHRFVFHHAPFIRQLHQQHHDEERTLLGTPVWFSLFAHAILLFLPAFIFFGATVASAISAGIMLGYLWYVSVHHIVHHWHAPHDSTLYRLKRRHALHHHAPDICNFGVTTGFWDRAFQTSAPDVFARRQVSQVAMQSPECF